MNTKRKWTTAATPVFQYVISQLEKCQEESLSALLCDKSDIGKTYAARHYCALHQNAVYIDCSQVKSRQRLIMAIAKGFKLDHQEKYTEIYRKLVTHLNAIQSPLIIFDEAGDLSYEAFLEIKALWNATELCCGFYMMGADGLEEKIARSIRNRKVGYTEIFSRFGKRYGHVMPAAEEEKINILHTSAAMIIKANCLPDTDINRLLKKCLGEDNYPSLRRIYKELIKEK